MKIFAVRCNKCKDTIFSRARHDFRQCTCKNIGIDGGQDGGYVKMSVMPGAKYEDIALDIKQNFKQLYADWNTGKDKFGLIKEK